MFWLKWFKFLVMNMHTKIISKQVVQKERNVSFGLSVFLSYACRFDGYALSLVFIEFFFIIIVKTISYDYYCMYFICKYNW